MHIPKIVEIKKIVLETETIKTFIFDWEVNDEIPGQFMMLWNFKDEKPMSMSLIDSVNNEIGFSIRKVGEFTESVHQLEVGDQIGIRGPYGRGFEIVGSKILAVGGGIGMAPVAAFAEESSRKGLEVDLVSAATTKDELIFMERLNKEETNYQPCTDDGTHGFGFAIQRRLQRRQGRSSDRQRKQRVNHHNPARSRDRQRQRHNPLHGDILRSSAPVGYPASATPGHHRQHPRSDDLRRRQRHDPVHGRSTVQHERWRDLE